MDDKMLTVSIRMVICGLWKDSRIARLAENEEILKFPNFDDYFVPDFYIYDLLDFKLSHFGEKNIQILSLTSDHYLRFYSEGIVTIACSMDFIKVKTILFPSGVPAHPSSIYSWFIKILSKFQFIYSTQFVVAQEYFKICFLKNIFLIAENESFKKQWRHNPFIFLLNNVCHFKI